MKRFLIVLLFILTACNSQKKASMENSESQTQENSPLTLILQDEHSGFESPETMVIKNQKHLNSLYAKINMTRKPGLPVPEIDFEKEMVVVQCGGEQNHGVMPMLSFSEETNSEIVLKSVVQKSADEASITVMTNPICVYKMPLTDKSVVINKEMK